MVSLSEDSSYLAERLEESELRVSTVAPPGDSIPESPIGRVQRGWILLIRYSLHCSDYRKMTILHQTVGYIYISRYE